MDAPLGGHALLQDVLLAAVEALAGRQGLDKSHQFRLCGDKRINEHCSSVPHLALLCFPLRSAVEGGIQRAQSSGSAIQAHRLALRVGALLRGRLGGHVGGLRRCKDFSGVRPAGRQFMLLHVLAEPLVRGLDELAEVDDVLHRSVVAAPQHEDKLHEVAEGKLTLHISGTLVIPIHLLIFGENEVDVVHQIDDVDTDLLQSPTRRGVLEKRREFLLGYPPVVVFVKTTRFHDRFQLPVQEGDRQTLLLRGSHGAHNLAKHSDEHVHDGDRREQHKEEVQGREEEAQVPQLFEWLADVIHERTTHEQRVHGGRHIGEIEIPNFAFFGQLRERDAEDVQQQTQQTEGEEHRASSSRDSLDQDHELRHRAQ
mmetsp:Transcript_64950/g.186641  ORF Transcript_64950/g.186641 Transcript_64950/m.186641 type:complete len:369 (+) Transcript_64950:340-1446(+)